MRNYLEKKGKNVILGNTAFCKGLFQSSLVYMCPAWRNKSENSKSFDFYWKGILLQFFKNHIFWKITLNFAKSS